jgi:Pregnancy-associated plasma protein-A
MKKSSIILLLFLCFLCFRAYPQTNPLCRTAVPTSGNSVSSQLCQTFTVRVYIHHVKGVQKPGYTSAIDATVMSNLNSSYNPYGISFKFMGSRDWLAPALSGGGYIADLATSGLIENIPSRGDNGKVNGAINIYLLPANFKGDIDGFGKANGIISDFIFLAGSRTVNPCTVAQKIYRIPEEKTVAHEMGHCFGLVHTFNTQTPNGGDDGLADTPFDNNQSNDCINPSTCTFTGGCTNCPSTSNPTTVMTNFMSYTVPTCMSVFSNQQLDLIKNNLNNNSLLINVVDSKSAQATGPDLSRITLETNAPVYSLTSVSVGTHYLFTYLDINLLTSNLTWTKTAGNSNSWGVSGTKNTNAWFTLAVGQSITLQITAQNNCGTSYRTLTFTAQSGFRLISSPTFSSTLSMDFDNVSYSEAMPQSVGIYNAQNGKEDKLINIKELFDSGYFKNNSKLDIDVKKIEKGKKVLRFMYAKGSENGKSIGEEYKTENIYIVD